MTSVSPTSRKNEERDDLNNIIHDWMQSFENDQDILDILAEARVPSGPVLAPYDAIGHPYFESRGAVREVNDPLLGNVHIPETHLGSLTFLNH